MPRPKALIEASLSKKGFKSSESHHHYFLYHTLDGKKSTVRTKTSHTPKMKDVPDPLLGQMAKQCKLSKAKFLDLIDCPMDRNTYEAELRRQGILP